MPARARVKWTRASLRRALEDEKAFDMARRCCGDGVTDQQIRSRIAWLLTWQRVRPGEPHLCDRVLPVPQPVRFCEHADGNLRGLPHP